MRWTIISTVLLTCCLTLLVARGLPAGTREAATPSVIAVVDGEVVLASIEIARRTKLEAEMIAEFKVQTADLASAELELKALLAEIQMLRKGSPEYNAKSRQRAVMQADLEFTGQLIRSEMDQKRVQVFSRLLDEIQQAAKDYADANGIDLVLQKQLRLEANGPLWNSVLHARAPLDITQEIVKVVNEP